nr:MAG TPA: hypothetical protein [Caudoviricetes sp.]
MIFLTHSLQKFYLLEPILQKRLKLSTIIILKKLLIILGQRDSLYIKSQFNI